MTGWSYDMCHKCIISHCTVVYWMPRHRCIMMTSWNGNIFRVTGPLCREFTGHRWIPLTGASDAKLWRIPWSAPEWAVEYTPGTAVFIILSIMCFPHCWSRVQGIRWTPVTPLAGDQYCWSFDLFLYICGYDGWVTIRWGRRDGMIFILGTC